MKRVVITWAGRSVTLEEGQYHAQIVSNGACLDVAWPFNGPTLLLANVSLEDPENAPKGDVLVDVDSQPVGVQVALRGRLGETYLPWLTAIHVVLPGDVDVYPPRLARTLSEYGHVQDAIPNEALLHYAVRGWRDYPDDNRTNKTGSGRVWADRVPGGVACVGLGQRGIRVPLDAVQRIMGDTAEQWTRGVHVLSPEGAGQWGLLPVPRSSWPEPWILNQGYTTSDTKRGGFHGLYSSGFPPGAPSGGTGRQACDAQHLAVDQQIVASVLAFDATAMLHAFCAADAAMSLLAVEDDPGRGLGHMARTIGLGLRATSDAAMHARWAVLADEFTARAKAHATLRAAARDKGNSTDSYHLSPDHIRTLFKALGITATDDAIREAARSASVWGHGIMRRGYSGEPLWADLAGVAEAFLLTAGTTPAFAVDGKGNPKGQQGAPYGIGWDDVSWVGDVAIGQGECVTNGLAARFLYPGLACSTRPRARALMRAIVDFQVDTGRWDMGFEKAQPFWRWVMESGGTAPETDEAIARMTT